MKQTFQKCVTFFGTFLFSWLVLSFYFFPLKTSAALLGTECFFWASVSHMAAIKLFISLLFSILRCSFLNNGQKRSGSEKTTPNKKKA